MSAISLATKEAACVGTDVIRSRDTFSSVGIITTGDERNDGHLSAARRTETLDGGIFDGVIRGHGFVSDDSAVVIVSRVCSGTSVRTKASKSAIQPGH